MIGADIPTISNSTLFTAVWDLENSLNFHKQDDASIHQQMMVGNSGSLRSDISENLSTTSHTSSEGGPITSPSNEIG